MTNIEISSQLQAFFDEKYLPGTCVVGESEDGLVVYEREPTDGKLPAWLSEMGIPVEFHYLGRIKPCLN